MSMMPMTPLMMGIPQWLETPTKGGLCMRVMNILPGVNHAAALPSVGGAAARNAGMSAGAAALPEGLPWSAPSAGSQNGPL